MLLTVTGYISILVEPAFSFFKIQTNEIEAHF